VDCELAGKNKFGHVSKGSLVIVAATIDAIIFHREVSKHVRSFFSKDKLISKDAVLVFQSETDEDWVLVETRTIWKDVVLDEDGTDFIHPGTSVECLLVGTADDVIGKVHLAIVLKEADGRDTDKFERIGLLVCKRDEIRALSHVYGSEMTIV
jgi:hypothetical protein